MGNVESSNTRVELKNQNLPIKLPMPDSSELERRFTKILASMDLPPDKAKVLKQYDDEKKWDLICDQERVQAKESPAFYITKLKTYLDPRASRSSRKRRMMGDSTSTQVLRDLEISLRTNHIEWVREFLNEDNQGLDILIDYLSFRQVIMRHEQIVSKSLKNSNEQIMTNGTLPTNRRPALDIDTPRMKRTSRHIQKLNMGDAKDDVHVCIMCLRAIMNNKYGFNMVIEHTEAINCIALSMNHKSLRTKALVLELLAAICLVKGGHEIILNAFDNFKEVCSEKYRFETLMEYFMNFDMFSIDFMAACMQFINIVVHSVEDMNFRVHLQYEFTKLGLDDYLEKLRYTESEELKVQISAYLDNVFDVAALMEDSETKNAALERAADMEEQLSHAQEKMQVLEENFLSKIIEMESHLNAVITERDELQERHIAISEDYSTLQKAISQKEEESRNRQNGTSLSGSDIGSPKKVVSAPPPPPPPPMPGPAPPPPPPPAMGPRGVFIPPPPPGMMLPTGDAMTIKKRVQTKYKLPTLNWIALKPNQVKGTIFNELDDDKLYNVIDFISFEEHFKIGQGLFLNSDTDSLQSFGSKRFKKPETVSLLEHNRLRNMAISRRKLDMPIDVVVRAINCLDMSALSLENVEILLRMIPSEQETKLYREYERERKPISALTDEDKFLIQLCKVERLSQKLNIMSYIGNFYENIQLITPQIQAIFVASRSIKNSKKIRKILEIILAFGNYLNSNKRGPAYGFKLQSLDLLMDTKSSDKRMTLLHFIVETIYSKFSDVANFDSELMFVEKAAIVSLENVLTDVHELEKGMEMAKKEFELCKDFKDAVVLKNFLPGAEDKLLKLQVDLKTSQDAFADVVEFFGESPRTLSATTFFSLFGRFIKAFRQAEIDNENRKRAEEASKESANQLSDNVVQKNKINRKNYQDAVINELKSKTRQVKDKKLLKQDEVYNGALEDILLGNEECNDCPDTLFVPIFYAINCKTLDDLLLQSD